MIGRTKKYFYGRKCLQRENRKCRNKKVRMIKCEANDASALRHEKESELIHKHGVFKAKHFTTFKVRL